MTHIYRADGTFEGKINGGVGSITYNGILGKEGLKALKITGAMIGSSMNLDLASST